MQLVVKYTSRKLFQEEEEHRDKGIGEEVVGSLRFAPTDLNTKVRNKAGSVSPWWSVSGPARWRKDWPGTQKAHFNSQRHQLCINLPSWPLLPIYNLAIWVPACLANLIISWKIT